MAEETKQEKVEFWAIVEIYGFKKVAGKVSEVTAFGGTFMRIDIPGPDGSIVASPHYGDKAIFSFTPVTERIARDFAKANQAEPVTVWDIPQRQIERYRLVPEEEPSDPDDV